MDAFLLLKPLAVALAAVGQGLERLLGPLVRVVRNGNRVGQRLLRFPRQIEEPLHRAGVVSQLIEERKGDIRGDALFLFISFHSYRSFRYIRGSMI